MISLDESTKDWVVDVIWKIAPAGLAWIEEGNGVRLGDNVRLGDGVTLGNGVRLGNGVTLGDDVRLGDKSTDAVDLGWADGYRKCIAQVDGVAYIGAGCRWFTLADAIKHWADREDRPLTRCLMQSAISVAGLRGWKHGDES